MKKSCFRSIFCWVFVDFDLDFAFWIRQLNFIYLSSVSSTLFKLMSIICVRCVVTLKSTLGRSVITSFSNTMNFLPICNKCKGKKLITPNHYIRRLKLNRSGHIVDFYLGFTKTHRDSTMHEKWGKLVMIQLTHAAGCTIQRNVWRNRNSWCLTNLR